jgi:polyferredoxin
MVETIVKKRSLRAEREFGLIVGGVLLLLSLWWLYRGKFPRAAQITLPLGAALVLLGLVFPRALVLPNKAWMGFAEVLAFVSTRIILAVVFFGIVTPIGVVKRLFGWDPLQRRAAPDDSYWKPYAERQRDPRHYEKMF